MPSTIKLKSDSIKEYFWLQAINKYCELRPSVIDLPLTTPTADVIVNKGTIFQLEFRPKYKYSRPAVAGNLCVTGGP